MGMTDWPNYSAAIVNRAGWCSPTQYTKLFYGYKDRRTEPGSGSSANWDVAAASVEIANHLMGKPTALDRDVFLRWLLSKAYNPALACNENEFMSADYFGLHALCAWLHACIAPKMDEKFPGEGWGAVADNAHGYLRAMLAWGALGGRPAVARNISADQTRTSPDKPTPLYGNGTPMTRFNGAWCSAVAHRRSWQVDYKSSPIRWFYLPESQVSNYAALLGLRDGGAWKGDMGPSAIRKHLEASGLIRWPFSDAEVERIKSAYQGNRDARLWLVELVNCWGGPREPVSVLIFSDGSTSIMESAGGSPTATLAVSTLMDSGHCTWASWDVGFRTHPDERMKPSGGSASFDLNARTATCQRNDGAFPPVTVELPKGELLLHVRAAGDAAPAVVVGGSQAPAAPVPGPAPAPAPAPEPPKKDKPSWIERMGL